jgi:hypothetical protein
LTACRSAALRLEMAEGRVQALTQGSETGHSLRALDEALFERDSERNRLHEAVREATGMDPRTLGRLLLL